MRISTGTAAAVLTLAAMITSTPAGQAAPAVPEAVAYTATRIGSAAQVSVDSGSLSVIDDQFQLLAPDGRVVAAVPLSYHLGDRVFPIEAVVSGRTATLTPIADPARGVAAPAVVTAEEVAAQTTKAERDRDAFVQMDAQVRFGVAIGAIIGGVLAGTVGCVVGGVVAAPSAVLTAVFGPLAGCVAGALVLAPVGAIGGTLLVSAPVALASVIQYFLTVTAPMPAPGR